MNTKEKIIAKINSIESEALLQEILELISIEADLNEVYEVSDEQKAAIDEGLNDVENGRVYTQSEADELIKEWSKGK